MIKLKNILTEAGVFDSPETYNIEPQKAMDMQMKGKEGGTSIAGVEPPYDGLMDKFMELDEAEREEAHDQMINMYDSILIDLDVTYNSLYGKAGMYHKMGEKAAKGEFKGVTGDEGLTPEAASTGIEYMHKQVAAKTAQAEEIELVLAYLVAGRKETPKYTPDEIDAEIEKLASERKKKMKKYLADENIKLQEKEAEVKEAKKEADELVKSKKGDFVSNVTKALETQQDLSNIDGPAKTAVDAIDKEAEALVNKLKGDVQSFIDKYSDEEDVDKEYEKFKKFQAYEKSKEGESKDTKEGMIKLKPLVEAGNDIDLSKVFMKGVGPGGEPNPDQLTDEPKAEKEIESALKDLDKEINRADLEPKKVNEALGLTLAGVALSMPAIIKLIGKFVNILKRVPGLKSLSGDKIIALGDKWHHRLINGVVIALKKVGVKDTIKAKKFANLIFHLIIAMLLFAGGAAAYKFATKGNVIGATLKTALNAIKTGEIRAFIISGAEAIS